VPPVPTPRVGKPPVDQRDYDDRHDTRATSSDAALSRYLRLGWHRTFQQLVPIMVLAVLYVGGVVVLPRLIPHLPIKEAMAIVSAGLASAGGGYGLYAAGQAVQRYRRGKGSGEDSTS
jgi:hypothetical protein